MKMVYDWSKVNWEKEQDVRIAEMLGCSRERVRQRRRELGMGKSINQFKRKENVVEVAIAGMDTSVMTLEEIAKCLKVKGIKTGVWTIKRFAKGLNKSYIHNDLRKISKYDWSKADWSKTDKEVALMLGVQNHGCVTNYRNRHGIKKIHSAAFYEKDRKVGDKSKVFQ